MKHLSFCILTKQRHGRRWRRLFACLVIGMLAIGYAGMVSIAIASESMSYAEARKVLTQTWEKSQGKWHNRYDNFRVSFIGKDKIELYARDRSDDDTFHDEKYCIDLVVMSYPYVEEAGFFDNYVGYRVNVNRGVTLYTLGEYEGMHIEWLSRPDAESFANALTVLKQYAIKEKNKQNSEVSSFADFQGKAWSWRTLAVKPGLPESVRRFRILAENAFDNKEFEKAADYYEQGLEIEPLWPEGQYNAAMIYGELKDYDNAALHMKRYLELVPAASDSQSARDQMIIWEEKSGKKYSKDIKSAVPMYPKETAQKMANLPLDSAIKIGNGKTIIVVFIDTNCYHCSNAYKYFSQRKDVTIYVFFYPLIQNSADKMLHILCSKDKIKTLDDVMNGKLDNEQHIAVCRTETLKTHVKLAIQVGLKGTPLIYIKGQVVDGFDLPVIEKLLQE